MYDFFTSILIRISHLWYGGLKENIFFLHIPKCGGTSIDYTIRRHYPFSNAHIAAAPSFYATKLIYQISDPTVNEYYYVLKFREYLLLYFMSQKIHFISGHFSFSEIVYRNFSDTYKYITLLRDPVKRWISHYSYNRYKTHSDHCRAEEDLAIFIQSERGKNLGHQYVKILGGLDRSGDYSSRQAIDRAKKNLHKFEIVGCLEHLEDFLKQFENRFGIKLKIPKKNQNPKSQSYITSIITKDIEEEITRICQPDLEVYEYAIDTFIKKN